MYYKALVQDYRIWDEVEKIESVTKFLEENKDKITALELSSNSINENVAKHLSEKIKDLKYLQVANFHDIFVSRKKDQIPEALKVLMLAIFDKNIRILNLSHNAFGPIGVESIDFFIKNTKNLMELNIENCGLGPEGSELLSNLLLENENKLNLQVLIINRNRLENKGAIAFSKVLAKFKTLERIEFAQNGIGEEGFNELFESFKENLNLRIINIEDNAIKSSAEILIKIIPLLKKLQVLKVSDSLLTEETSVSLFDAIKELENLKIIECNYNEIEDPKNQVKIFEILLNNKEKLKSLKKVTLRGNEIDKKVFKKFSEEIAKNYSEFEAYSDEEMDADKYPELPEDEFGNLRIKD